MTDNECPGCGSTPSDREVYASKNSEPTNTALKSCRHCGTDKCCMCDMGDDVECVSCTNEEDFA